MIKELEKTKEFMKNKKRQGSPWGKEKGVWWGDN
jgi:hypothetical protein